MSSYSKDGHNLESWLLSLDHKRIGIMYLVVMLVSFLLGGILAVLLRTELLGPGQVLMDAGTFNKVFTFHGIVMIFLFIIPAIPAVLGNFSLPLMLGTENLAHPRMNRLSFWLFSVGSLWTIASLLINSLSTGWTFYTPYNAASGCRVLCVTAGLVVLGMSTLLTGLNFILTIHKHRPARMTWSRLPIFAWTLYFSSIVGIFASLVLAVILQLLIAERFGGKGVFDPALGGDAALFQKLFWLYAHPVVYLTILPAIGIVSELIAIFSRKPIFSYRSVVYCSAAIAFFGFFSWGQQLLTSGQPAKTSAIFSLMALSLFVPSAVMVIIWLGTLYRGSLRLAAPMLYGLMFIVHFSITALSGLLLGNMTTGVHLQGSTFASAHLHYMLMGGTLFAFIGGLHYWWPKMFGRMYSEKWAAIAAFFIFLGLNISLIPQMAVGMRGLPQRFYGYPMEFLCESRLSSLGAYILAFGFIIVGSYLIHSLRSGVESSGEHWDV